MNSTDHIQVVTFQLAGLDPDVYRAHCEAAASSRILALVRAKASLPVNLVW